VLSEREITCCVDATLSNNGRRSTNGVLNMNAAVPVAQYAENKLNEPLAKRLVCVGGLTEPIKESHVIQISVGTPNEK
jgi:hypothetical protein